MQNHTYCITKVFNPYSDCTSGSDTTVGTSYVKTSEFLDKQQILLDKLLTNSRTHEQVDLLVSLIKSSSLENELLRFLNPGDNAQHLETGENHNFDFGSLESLVSTNLNGINFLDWFRNLRIVLKQERKEHVIEEPVPDEPTANAPRADKDKFKKYMDDMVDVGCLMLATMDSELQKQHENMVAYEMIQNLKEIYEGQARQERYETSKALFQCKMTEGTLVGAHVIKMMGYVQTLEKLGFPLKNELATDLILQSLPGSFKPFVLNFNMNEINRTLPQLLGMLRTAESDMKKDGSKSILLVREAKENGKKVAKSKGSGKTKAKGKNVLKPKGAISKDGKCFHCNKSGHWKRNCPVYLEEVKKAKAVGASVSGIYVIDVNMSTSSSWVLDTGCGSHICTSV
ncbi:hypothetical protein V6N12_065781 [Hibiscus sabdariffa]|uniref:CCHC-type domain-containing protein n=1 Tax=Hibiscus sabdariffa TaxID=183260 RepID=A0ABR2G9P8_9ROSI